jgi:hypothetical protein
VNGRNEPGQATIDYGGTEKTDEASELVVLSVQPLALALLLALLLLGVMASIEASDRGAECAVMAGIVTSDAADDGALDAALGVGRCGDGSQNQCGGGQCDQGFHDAISRRFKRISHL